MNKELKIAIFQLDMIWEAPEANCKKVAEWIASPAAADADLVVLPEMFATGFNMNPEAIAQPMDGYIVNFMRDLAVSSGKAIITSIAIEDHVRRTEPEMGYFNRLFFFTPDGVWLTYNKRHLFRMAGEHNIYTEGRERLIVHYKGFRICPLICYDLRFPVFSRNRNQYDILVYVACWPAVRSFAWSSLLVARAIENQAFVIGVNRVGSDPKNVYSGDSVVLDFMGKEITSVEPSTEGLAFTTISLNALEQFREGFPAHLDADTFALVD